MTCGTTPWARMITVPDVASFKVSARPTPASASSRTTIGLWMSGPSVWT